MLKNPNEFAVGEKVRMGQVIMPEDRLYEGEIVQVNEYTLDIRVFLNDKPTSTVLNYSPEFVHKVEEVPFKEKIKTIGFTRVPGGTR